MIPSSIRPQRGPFKPAPHAAALLPALARARPAPGTSTRAVPARARGQRTRYRRTRQRCTHGTGTHSVNVPDTGVHAVPTRTASTHTAPTHTQFQRAHGVNAHGTGIHDANAQTGLTRTQFSRARTLTHEPCLRTRGLHSPPEVIIQRLENVGYERLFFLDSNPLIISAGKRHNKNGGYE